MTASPSPYTMPPIPARIRASDAERERVAALIQNAVTEGRLTISEVEERLTAVYEVKYVDELSALTADLPQERPQRRPSFVPAPALRVHAAIVVLIGILLVVRWSVSGAPYFWPVAPMFWLVMSLVVHARIRRSRAML
ncbi:DUF1707 SHOCT-like domain-containing protein [Amycolatopsis nigrescens]|uniref:DUF1707 SHOCT-like domain-containing protein n=1 Tax=Amycolatopsis nigrescens TaxID=381445 RepID=UPI0003A8E14E|nr:DUF1707 domain-containing protein [Amycolatopsis nigrescens]